MKSFTSTTPAARNEPRWVNTLSTQLAQTQTIANFEGTVDLLLLGDSITEGCEWVGEYQQHLKGMKILMYGIGGDKTQHVLWRIENGILNGISPKYGTLLIGINNFWPETSVEEVAAGAIACGRAMYEKLPNTKLFHFGVFSVGSGAFSFNGKIDAINELIEAAAPSYNAHYVSLRDVFLTADGHEIPGMISADGIHITGKAYDAWGAKVKALIA